jgi:hypothetical protein
VKPVSSPFERWLIAGGYAVAFAIGAVLLLQRYILEITHRADVSAAGGMWAFGDLILGIIVVCLFLIPTFFLVRVMARSEAAYTTYSQLLFGISLSSPVCLGLLYFQNSMPESFGILFQYRLFWSPLILVGIGASWFMARFARAKRLNSYAFLVEGLTLSIAVVLLIEHR